MFFRFLCHSWIAGGAVCLTKRQFRLLLAYKTYTEVAGHCGIDTHAEPFPRAREYFSVFLPMPVFARTIIGSIIVRYEGITVSDFEFGMSYLEPISDGTDPNWKAQRDNIGYSTLFLRSSCVMLTTPLAI